jgi:hypothetical protein
MTLGEPPTLAPPRRRLFRKYALLFIGLVGAALLITSGFDFWFSYQETKSALIRLQQEKAVAAAERIEGFVEEIEQQIGWTTHTQWAALPLDQRRQDYFRLLRQVPAITEVQSRSRGSRTAQGLAIGNGMRSAAGPIFRKALLLLGPKLIASGSPRCTSACNPSRMSRWQWRIRAATAG